MSIELIIFKNDTDAPATNRGYIFQYLKTMIQWLDIYQENTDHVIYCEVEDDIKKINYKKGSIEWTQIKCYSSAFSLQNNEIRKTLYNFYILYLYYEDYDGEFIFDTNSSPSTTDLILTDWIKKRSILENEVDLLNNLISYFQKVLNEKFLEKKNKLIEKKIHDELTIEELGLNVEQKINDTISLSTFIKRITWRFESIEPCTSIIKLKNDLIYKIEKLNIGNSGNSKLYFYRLLAEIVFKSSFRDNNQRYIDRNLLKNILNETKEELEFNVRRKEVTAMMNEIGKMFAENAIAISDEFSQIKQHLSLITENKPIRYTDKHLEESLEYLYSWENENYVETSFFEIAKNKLNDNNFVFLVGERNVGKTSTAYSLSFDLMNRYDIQPCLTNVVEFEKHYSSLSPSRIYVFDDVFGDNIFDEERFGAIFKSFFFKIKHAQEKGSYIIFTSTIYVFKRFFRDASYKYNFSSIIGDLNDIVNIKEFTEDDRKAILLQYMRNSDLPDDKKKKIRPFMNQLSKSMNFKPELAQCLADKKFWEQREITYSSVFELFEKPNKFGEILFRQLDEKHKISLLLVFITEDGLVDPVRKEDLKNFNDTYYIIEAHEVNNALKDMENELVELQIIEKRKIWVPKKAYLKNAILPIFKERVDLFVKLADMNVLLRETYFPENDKKHVEKSLVCLDSSCWETLINKLNNIYSNLEFGSDDFFVNRRYLQGFFINSSKEFLLELFSSDRISGSMLDDLSINYFSHLHSHLTYEYVKKMIDLNLLSEAVIQRVRLEISEKVKNDFNILFFYGTISDLLDDKIYKELLDTYAINGLDLALKDIDDEFAEDEDFYGNTEESFNSYYKNWLYEVDLLEKELKKFKLWSGIHQDKKNGIIKEAEEILQTAISSLEDRNDQIKDFIEDFIYQIEPLDEPDSIKIEMISILDTLCDEFYLNYDEAIEELVQQLKISASEGEMWFEIFEEKLNLCKDNFFESVGE